MWLATAPPLLPTLRVGKYDCTLHEPFATVHSNASPCGTGHAIIAHYSVVIIIIIITVKIRTMKIIIT